MASFTLDGSYLDYATLSRVFWEKQTLELSAKATDSSPAVADLPAAGEMSRTYLEAQVVTYGPETEEKIIRLALLLLVHAQLRQGGQQAGQTATLQRLLAFYNREVYPVVLGFGADTSRLAQLCQPLLLAGKVRFQGYPLKASEVAEMFSWSPVPLTAPEVQSLLNQPVFSWAQASDLLMNLKPLTNWFIYYDAVFSRILPDSNADLHRALKALIQDLDQVQQALEAAVNGEKESTTLQVALANLAQNLPQVLEHLSTLGQILLDGLETMVEPPATATYTLARELGRQISLQAVAGLIREPQPLTLLLAQLSQQLFWSQSLANLVFWSFLQADVISGDFLESSTLQAYQQAGLFVPEETVNDQLVKIAEFIQTHTPISAA